MTIHLTPEQEQIIRSNIENGTFRNTADALDHAIASLQINTANRSGKRRKNLAQFLLESPLAGAELDLRRPVDFGRPIEL